MSGPIIIAVVSLLIGAAGAPADEEPAGLERFDARAAVQYGNERLIQGDAPQALEAYKHAEDLRPDALEIPFVKGLGHYALGEYEPAREAFEKAALSKRRKLADDAIYSVGTTFHAEALESQAEPQVAIEKLENALQRYQSVLASQSDHAPARDAIVKAAAMRRQLIRMLEQQQQQNQDQDKQNNEDNPEDQQQQQQGQDQNQDDEQEQSESQQEQSADESDDQQDQQQSAQQDEEQEAQSAQQQEDDEQREMQESQAEQQEQNSREQAQRRLREMMQNIQERQKRRREKPQPFRVVPVDKDW